MNLIVFAFLICSFRASSTMESFDSINRKTHLTRIYIETHVLPPYCSTTGKSPRVLAIRSLGTSCPLVDEFHAIPVEHRIMVLRTLGNLFMRKSIRTAVKKFRSALLRRYAAFVESEMYMELGVLRVMFRYAYDCLLPEERHIETAEDMYVFLRESFLQKYNHDLNMISPRRILRWYNLILDRGFEIHKIRGPAQYKPLSETELVVRHIRDWRVRFVSSQLAQLATTGYEYL